MHTLSPFQQGFSVPRTSQVLGCPTFSPVLRQGWGEGFSLGETFESAVLPNSLASFDVQHALGTYSRGGSALTLSVCPGEWVQAGPEAIAEPMLYSGLVTRLVNTSE